MDIKHSCRETLSSENSMTLDSFFFYKNLTSTGAFFFLIVILFGSVNANAAVMSNA